MLQFSVESINSSEVVKNLLFVLLDKNKKIAGELFKWVNASFRGYSVNWNAEFKQKYAEVDLE